jgi:hypothetical protein
MSIANQLNDNMSIVADILERSEKARDDDKRLYAIYLKDYTPIGNMAGVNGVDVLKVLLRPDVATPETITRCRRKLQEKGLYWGEKKLKRQQDAEEVSLWATQN